MVVGLKANSVKIATNSYLIVNLLILLNVEHLRLCGGEIWADKISEENEKSALVSL